MTDLALQTVRLLASEHGAPELDALLIAANYYGASSVTGYTRGRMQLQPLHSSETWQLILPLDNVNSPFVLDEATLFLGDHAVAQVAAFENDDVVLTYVRGGGRSLTLNTHSRSHCTGCIFCPNIIEDAADANVDGPTGLNLVLRWAEVENGWHDLSGVEVITVCTGCFHEPSAAITHLVDLRRAATEHGFTGRLHFLSSVIRDRRDIERLAAEAAPFHLTLTVECFTRRNLLLKDTKASLTLDEACRILDDCAELDILGDFTYVAGLDQFQDTVAGLRQLIGHCTTFPRIQVFQAHNLFMERVKSRDATSLEFFLKVRSALAPELAQRGLRPVSWENYRPLWYSSFAGRPVGGPRV